MKKVSLALTALALVALMATAALANKHADDPRGDRAQKLWQRAVERLQLTPEQQARLQPIFDAHLEQVKAQHKTARARFEAVLTPAQKEKMQQMVAERRAERQKDGEYPKGGESRKGNGSAAKRGEGAKAMFATLGLTDAQKADLKRIRGENLAEMKAQRQQFVAQVEAVLTPTQKTQFEEMRSRRARHRGDKSSEAPAETNK